MDAAAESSKNHPLKQREEYGRLLCQSDTEARAMHWNVRAAARRTKWAFLWASFVLVICGVALVCLLQPHKSQDLVEHELQSIVTKSEDTCIIEQNIDYETSKALFAMQGIKSQELCRQKCREDSRCGAWTWGKTRDYWGLTNMCFLKALGMHQKPTKHRNNKVVSGLPCRPPSDEASVSRRSEMPPPSQAMTKIFDIADVVKEEVAEKEGDLFCFALMLPGSYEQDLLAMQFKISTNIFACDKHAVYSSKSVELAEGLKTRIVDSDLKCHKGGEFGTALNTEIFMAVWKQVIEDDIYNTCSWTVKADPDCVFLAPRLLHILKRMPETGEGVYLNNCRMGMHGPLEVFSRNAVRSWGKGAKRCFQHFYKLCSGPCLWGEDMFVDQCLSKVLKLTRKNVYTLLTEDHCDPPKGWDDCRNRSSVAFHPFKTLHEYEFCLANAEPNKFKDMEARAIKDKNIFLAEQKAKDKTKVLSPNGSKKEDSCRVDDNTDYQTQKGLFAMEGIISLKICRNKCNDDSRCGAWTWGKTRDTWSLTNMCFLKVVHGDESIIKIHDSKVVSGLPCRRSKEAESSRPKKGDEPSSALMNNFELIGENLPEPMLPDLPLGLLYCFSLMIPGSYEQALLAWQYAHRTNLFACDASTVYSNKSVEVADGLVTHVVNNSLHCEKGGEFGTVLNTDIFMAVWRRVIMDSIFAKYSWTVKVDPDSVFVAHRLRDSLTKFNESRSGVYLNNCKMGLHGPLEVLSRKAIVAWGKGSQKCFSHFYKLCSGPCLWGEDMFIDQCLEKVLKVKRVLMSKLLTEAHCDPPEDWESCEDNSSIAFHPFKTLAAYEKCLKTTTISNEDVDKFRFK